VRLGHRPLRLTWQVVPRVLDRYLMDPDPKKADRVMRAMLSKTRLEIKPAGGRLPPTLSAGRSASPNRVMRAAT